MSKRVEKILGDYLHAQKLLSTQAWDELLRESRRQQEDLVSFIAAKGLLTERELLVVLAEAMKLPLVDLSAVAVDSAVIERVPIRIASYYKFMPLEIKNKTLTVAVTCPFDIMVQDEIRTHLSLSIEMVLAPRADVANAMRNVYGLGAQTMERLVTASGGRRELAESTSRAEKVENIEELAEDASVIRLVNEIILEAYRKRATDIHIEPYRADVAVRYRIDGVLYDAKVSADVKSFFAPIISRIKIMSSLDIVERRLPQDGRAIVKTQEQSLDLRISTLPTPFGESVVVRILPTKILYSLERLGLSTQYLRVLEELIQKPHGILFLTGPTGSGKTTTLYACLNKINTRDRKIITLEDPIEYEMEGMTQIQVQPDIGLDFARGLRSVLRHDPDIVMVGEVRDLETAEIAIRVSLTGHLIFSTLHTNDAASGITRLIDIGIEPYLVASSVEALIAQRLVRVLCPSCKQEHASYPRELRENIAKELGLSSADEARVFQARGCDKCNGTGFFGRTAIYEMLLIDDPIKELILRRAPSGEIKKLAHARGMMTLFQDGLRKIVSGLTTPEEVLRVVAGEEGVFEEGHSQFGVGQDRRSYRRLDARINIRYKLVKSKGQAIKETAMPEKFAISSNLSAGGIAFTVAEDIAVENVLELVIDLPDKEGSLKCFGKVMWTEKTGSDQFEAGVCFLDLTGGERARLDKYVVEESQS